ncbi:putative dehydrogenase [Escherichia coli]|uniref:Putative dehydrogenase n=1 Tax=Escherichia coli TaxID=562 RepID=A0A2X1N855_ECOLX|nr:putative dehydrogenase [Escherichia coli]
MMRLCEMNFSQLRRLLPRNDAPGETVSYQVANAQYRLTIVESTRYTTLVTIEQTAPRDQLLEPSVNDGASVS